MNIPSLIIGLGALLAGGRTVQQALLGDAEPNSGQLPSRDRTPMRVTTHQVHSIDQRVGYIARMIRKGREHPEVRKRTAQLLSRKCKSATTGKPTWCIPEKDWEAEVVAIFRAVRQAVRYTRDTHGKDLFQHPRRTLEFAAGDCDDLVIVLGSMLQSVGYPIKLRVIRTKGAADWDHIYLLVGLPPQRPSRWVPLDASVDKRPGWQPSAAQIETTRDFRLL